MNGKTKSNRYMALVQDDEDTNTGNETSFNGKGKMKQRQLYSVDEEKTLEHSGHLDPLNPESFITPASINTSAGNRQVRAGHKGKDTLGGVVASSSRIPPSNMATMYASPTQ